MTTQFFVCLPHVFTFEVADVPQMSKKAFNGPQIYIKKLGDELKNQKGNPYF